MYVGSGGVSMCMWVVVVLTRVCKCTKLNLWIGTNEASGQVIGLCTSQLYPITV